MIVGPTCIVLVTIGMGKLFDNLVVNSLVVLLNSESTNFMIVRKWHVMGGLAIYVA